MKVIVSVLTATIFCCHAVNAQAPEVKTYFVEKNGFQVDFPSDWGVGIKEAQTLRKLWGDPIFTSALVAMKTDAEGSVVMIRTQVGCKNSRSFMQSFVSILQKDAKRNKDLAFLIHSQGNGETADHKEFSFTDYTHTLLRETGGSQVLRDKFYAACHMYDKVPFLITYSFISQEADWDKLSPTFEAIFNSIKYKAK